MSASAAELPLLGRSLLALAAVLALLVAGRWLLLRRAAIGFGGAGQADAGLSVAASVALDGRHRLVVVRHRGAELLLAVGPQGVSRLDAPPAGRWGAERGDRLEPR